MLASLGKENAAADIKGIFELKLASRSKKQRLTIAHMLASPNKENKQIQKEKSETDIIDMDDLSSISSVRSDNELWDCIEMRRGSRLSRLERISLGSDQAKNRMFKDNDLFYPSSENFMDKDSGDLKSRLEKYETTIEKLKEAHRIEMTTFAETLKNKTKDMLLHKAEELKRHFEREMRNLVIQATEAKRLLAIREAEIIKLKELVQQQEMSLNLIKSNGIYKPTIKPVKSIEIADDTSYSKEELSALKKELESMKAILLTFKREDEIKTRELAKTRQEMNNLTRQHAENIQKLTKQLEEKLKDSEDQAKMNEIKCQRVQKELEKFKINTDLEIKVLKTLNDRYKQKTEKNENVMPLKEVFPRVKGGTALTDILNTSVGSEALQSRYSSQPHNTSFEHKVRVRASSKGRPGLDSLEAPSLTALESFSNGISTANPKSKVTFLDSSKNESIEM